MNRSVAALFFLSIFSFCPVVNTQNKNEFVVTNKKKKIKTTKRALKVQAYESLVDNIMQLVETIEHLAKGLKGGDVIQNLARELSENVKQAKSFLEGTDSFETMSRKEIDEFINQTNRRSSQIVALLDSRS